MSVLSVLRKPWQFLLPLFVGAKFYIQTEWVTGFTSHQQI
ncbi:hypothetical protein Ple7327_1331 [Pleurocapsa sp. PCC 7327]|nr:hypothetical protein Ple7327_1331 [Pleurocapsa sp. PCC 7327]